MRISKKYLIRELVQERTTWSTVVLRRTSIFVETYNAPPSLDKKLIFAERYAFLHSTGRTGQIHGSHTSSNEFPIINGRKPHGYCSLLLLPFKLQGQQARSHL